MSFLRFFLGLFFFIFLLNETAIGQSIQISSTNAFFCTNENVSINYSITGTFSNENIFLAQLSDSSGQYLLPTNIGSASGNTSGIIQAQLPNNLTPSGGYKIRVVSSNPNVISSNAINVPIQNIQLDSWVRRADVGTLPKNFGTGFAIENKLYFGSGSSGSYTTNDFWEYNSINNTIVGFFNISPRFS